jgi:hypothetical protein
VSAAPPTVRRRAPGPWLVAAVLIAGVAAGPILRAQAPDISGSWELSFDGRRVPPANLTPRVTRAILDEVARKDARSIRWCNLLGMPFTMGQSRPLEIRQGSRFVVVVAESAASPARYLYLNRKAHIPTEEFEPTTNGDSIARWEGDTLVVDTVGFSPTKGMLAIPGGGFRTENTHLIERYRLLKGGSLLSVTFTWEDPRVFRTPHTYEFRYHRLPAGYEARPAIPCDPFDADRTAFLEGPVSPRK